jgi:predicted negative regulator of RcsB-dependent stress response
MATLESSDSNILDAEAINWRLIVYPLLAAVLLIAGGFFYYYYQQNQRDVVEAQAREAMLKATTPDDLIAVANKFPGTDQATLALLSAAKDSFTLRDFDAAAKDYQRIAAIPGVIGELHDSAQLGLASSLEANTKIDDAINTYLEVAQQGDKSPYAPFAYIAAARLYDQRGDKDNERKILTEASSLDPDSQFVKEAQNRLKQLDAESMPPATTPTPGNPTPVVPSAPAPTTDKP